MAREVIETVRDKNQGEKGGGGKCDVASSKEDQPRPAGLINTLEASGWKASSKHTTDANDIDTRMRRVQQGNIKVLCAQICEATMLNNTAVLHEAVQQLKLQIFEEHFDAQEDLVRLARSKASKKQSRRNHTGVGSVQGGSPHH